MTKLTRGLLVSETDQRDTEMLGDATKQFASTEINKAVVLAGIQCDLAAINEEIFGFCEVVDPATSDGHSVGTIKKTGRMRCQIGAGEIGTLAIGALVAAFTASETGAAKFRKI